MERVEFEAFGEIFDGLDEAFGLEADAAEQMQHVGGAVGILVDQRVDEPGLKGRREKQRLLAFGETLQLEARLREEKTTSRRFRAGAARL